MQVSLTSKSRNRTKSVVHLNVFHKLHLICIIITNRTRSTTGGYDFTGVCLSTGGRVSQSWLGVPQSWLSRYSCPGYPKVRSRVPLQKGPGKEPTTGYPLEMTWNQTPGKESGTGITPGVWTDKQIENFVFSHPSECGR